MGILGRYIARAWLRMFALCLGSFVAIYLVLDMMEKVPRFVRVGGAAEDILRYFLYKLPDMAGEAAHFSVLMATLLTLGLFSRNSEIIAMRGGGVSLFRISSPMLLLGLLVSGMLLVNAELVVPRTYERMDRVERVDIKKQSTNAVFKRNNIWFRSETMILQAQLFDPSARTLQGVVIWILDRSMSPLGRIDAEAAVFSDGRWILHKAVKKDFTGGSGFASQVLPVMAIDLNLRVDDLKVLGRDADNLSYQRLREYADNLQSGGYKAYRYLTLMHNKFSAPFAAFVMVVLGIPFALRNSRSGGIALGIGASIGIGFVYFVVNAVLLSYGRSGILPPIVAAWGTNILFMMGGVWLAMTVKN